MCERYKQWKHSIWFLLPQIRTRRYWEGRFFRHSFLWNTTSISHYLSESFLNYDDFLNSDMKLELLFCFCRKFFNGARMGTCCTTFTQPFNKIFSTIGISVVCYITSLLTVLPFSTRNSIIDGWFLMVCWWISKWRHCTKL